MARLRNPLADVRPTTFGILGLTALWTAFQVLDDNPPTILDQALVAAFGFWFAAEAKRESRKLRHKLGDDEQDDEEL